MHSARVRVSPVSSALVGAFTQRKCNERSVRSTYTPSRNSIWKWIFCAAEALDQGDRTRVGRFTAKARLVDQVRGDAAVDDAEHPAHDIGAAGEQEAQRIRDAQHLLAHRLLRKDLVNQKRGTLGHAPGAAAGTETPALAAEGDQVLGMTAFAAHAQEAVLRAAALEVILELPLNIPRQGRVLGRQMRRELWIVFLNNCGTEITQRCPPLR